MRPFVQSREAHSSLVAREKKSEETLNGFSHSDSCTHKKDWAKVSSDLAQDRRAWSASVRDVVNLIGDAGSTRSWLMPKQVQVQKSGP